MSKMAYDKLKNKLLAHQNRTKIKVRFNDTDAMGIVHFMNYMMYFDDGFVSFMNSLNGSKKIADMIYENLAFGVKNVNITYERPAKFGDYLIVSTIIEKIGKSSITFSHEIFRESNNEKLAVIMTVRFVLNLSTNQLMDILDFFSFFLNK